MIKDYFNLSVILFSSWSVYSYCQEETLLPLTAGVILIISFILRLKNSEKGFSFFNRIPLSLIIISSLVMGYFYRTLFPAPEIATSPFPNMTAALQSGTIFAAIFFWLKPFTKENLYRLAFLSALTVAVSINVPFTNTMLLIFCSYCLMTIAFIILQTMKKPKERKNIFLYYRDFIVFSSILVLLTTGLFYGISQTIVIFDRTFMYLMRGIITPRIYTNFLNIDQQLTLVTPGNSAWDRRPVLEITLPGSNKVYLKTQVFKDYDNGTWKDVQDPNPKPLNNTLDPTLPKAQMMMFTSFENIIPSLAGITAAKGTTRFTQSKDNIVYSEDDEQRSRIIKFSITSQKKSVSLNSQQMIDYSYVPFEIAPLFKEVSSEIVGNETDPAKKALLLRNFFVDNFNYSLNVNFSANNQGLIDMIQNKRSAYCTYFATALTFFLRSQGIPARVATGFVADEIINKRTNKLLARVYDAHAWTEVLLPIIDEKSGKKHMTWQIFDATPPAARNQAIANRNIFFIKMAEKVWLTSLRFSAYVENIDKNELKKTLLIILILIMAAINRQNILKAIRSLILNSRKRIPLKRKKTDLVQLIYQRYENYLKNTFDETRQLSDTDQEVLARLKKRSDIPPETIAKIESFVNQYHAVRFGQQKDINLESIIHSIE